LERCFICSWFIGVRGVGPSVKLGLSLGDGGVEVTVQFEASARVLLSKHLSSRVGYGHSRVSISRCTEMRWQCIIQPIYLDEQVAVSLSLPPEKQFTPLNTRRRPVKAHCFLHADVCHLRLLVPRQLSPQLSLILLPKTGDV
jgi:hypothetical protein